MGKFISAEEWKVVRVDLLRAALLVILCCLIWCTAYNRWTVASWQTPINYLSPDFDVPLMLAWIKAGGEGHLYPFHYSFVPELGAPFNGNWNDFPVTEKPLFCVAGWLSRIVGLFAAANLAVMAAQVLAALSFYTACRLLHSAWMWAFAGAVVFGFSRFAFAHELHHINVLYYWHIPLALVVVKWIASGDGIRFLERRFIFALVVAFISGTQHIYYTDLLAQFIILAGFVQGWRCGWMKIWPAVVILAALLSAGLLMNLNTIVYQHVYGANPGAVERMYMWLEVYGLKFVDLIVPPLNHRLPVFAQWAGHHLGETFLSWGEMPPTGYIGLIGLASLVWLAAASFRTVMNHCRPPVELWLVFWVFIYGGVGGINGLIGSWGSLLFRATTRFSIFILCIVLMFAVQRLSLMNFRWKFLTYAAALLAAALALWDQVPPLVSSQSIIATAQDVDWDRIFTREMEEHLPPNAMVFQIPVVGFPEIMLPGVGPYDHFRPYFFAHHLRFSFGSVKGRSREGWQGNVVQLKPEETIARLESYGFGAVYVNTNWLPDRGAPILTALQQMGRTDKIEDGRGDLVCVFLKPSPHPILPPDH